jgi:excisionase family DNA binding protein
MDMTMPTNTTRRTYTVEEAALLLGISRSTAYECVKSGEIPSLRLRRRIVVPTHAIESILTTASQRPIS